MDGIHSFNHPDVVLSVYSYPWEATVWTLMICSSWRRSQHELWYCLGILCLVLVFPTTPWVYLPQLRTEKIKEPTIHVGKHEPPKINSFGTWSHNGPCKDDEFPPLPGGTKQTPEGSSRSSSSGVTSLRGANRSTLWGCLHHMGCSSHTHLEARGV